MPGGRFLRHIGAARLMMSHHCQFVWFSVGKSLKRGWLESQQIPKVWGGSPLVQIVFQKMGPNPSCTSERTCSGSASTRTRPPCSSIESASGSKLDVTCAFSESRIEPVFGNSLQLLQKSKTVGLAGLRKAVKSRFRCGHRPVHIGTVTHGYAHIS